MGLGFGITFLVNMLVLMHFRKKSWCPSKFRWSLTIVFASVGLVGIIFNPTLFDYEDICFTQFFSPIIYNSTDWLFKEISFKKQDRDFYLSSNIDFWVNNGTYIQTTLDEILSGGLYVLIAILPVILLGLQKLIWLI
jgi:hypothetical protein